MKKLKYLKDQFRWEESTDVRQVIATRNAVWMEPQPKYYIKLSIDNLRTSDEALQCINILSEKLKRERDDGWIILQTLSRMIILMVTNRSWRL